jgi:SAM-dependent methyltransferase
MSTDEHSRQWYNDNATGYTKHVRDPDDSIYHSLYEKPAMYALLPDLKGKSVISLGCGSGEDCNYLSKRGASRVTGIDLSEGMIEIAKASYPDFDLRVMDMEHLDFLDNSFDFAYSSLAVHYIEDWHRLMSEVYRVLKPKSYFLLSANHPVAYASDIVLDDDKTRKKELSRTLNKDTGTVTIVGDYLSRAVLPGDKDLDVTTWRKSIGEIATEATDEGFLIAGISEPKPLPKMRELRQDTYEKLSKIPEFVIFKLLKP